MQAAQYRFVFSNNSSDTYSIAYRQAHEALGATPLSALKLARMDRFSRELAAGLRDSSESLRDVRRICRQAVIDATRAHLGGEITRLIAELDDARRRGVRSAGLDNAICSAFGARVRLDSSPFHETLRHLESARKTFDSLTPAM